MTDETTTLADDELVTEPTWTATPGVTAETGDDTDDTDTTDSDSGDDADTIDAH